VCEAEEDEADGPIFLTYEGFYRFFDVLRFCDHHALKPYY
jgi:hypothetical protein